MMALLLTGYASGIYSSRRIAKACIERADFVMIAALDAPDFRTISEFRKRHLEQLAGLFVQVLKLAEQAGTRLPPVPVARPGKRPCRMGDDLHRPQPRKARILIGSSSYHGGLSGLVKNALDYAEDLRNEGSAAFSKDDR
jgi:Transposase domain (DUF772)